MKLKIAIIGSGVFGLTAAIKLSQIKNSNIVVFEQHNKPFYGATYANHNRHHYGFHYPKSQLTIDQINKSKKEFESEYFNNAQESIRLNIPLFIQDLYKKYKNVKA